MSTKRENNDSSLFQELGSQPLPTISTDDMEPQALSRPRSGTWGSKSDTKHAKEKDSSKQKSKEHKSKFDSKADGKQQKEKKKDKHSASRSGSTSRSNSAERRKSGEDVQSPKKAGMLEAFRTRSHSDAAKKKPNALMATMRNAMLVSILINIKNYKLNGNVSDTLSLFSY